MVPSQADVDKALDKAKHRVVKERLDVNDPLQMLDAALDALVLKDRRSGPESADADFRQIKLRDLRKTLASGEAHLVSHAVDQVLEQTGTIAPDGSPEHRDLVQKLIRAEIEALQRTLERDQGDYGGTPNRQADIGCYGARCNACWGSRCCWTPAG
ncbi:MAG: hypothetical protein ACSHXB_17155 [Sulfitobacter sp.]